MVVTCVGTYPTKSKVTMVDEMGTSALSEHMIRMNEKFDDLQNVVKEHIAKDEKYYNYNNDKDTSMTDNSALIAAMLAGKEEGGVLGGAGGGFAGAALGSLLLGRGGLLGGVGAVAPVDGVGGVSNATFTAGITGVTDAIQNTQVMQGIGDIKAAVPLAEAQMQLALAGTQAALSNQMNTSLTVAVQGQALINKNISDAIATSLASQNSIKESVAAYGVANLTATKDAQYALANAIKDDGEKTRALITSNTISELQRQLTVAETAALEDRLRGRARETEINITNTNTAIAAQAQAQQQQQQQTILLSNLCHIVGGLQNAVATNSNLIVGNTGAVATGAQTSNPVNVKA